MRTPCQFLTTTSTIPTFLDVKAYRRTPRAYPHRRSVLRTQCQRGHMLNLRKRLVSQRPQEQEPVNQRLLSPRERLQCRVRRPSPRRAASRSYGAATNVLLQNQPPGALTASFLNHLHYCSRIYTVFHLMYFTSILK